MTKEQFLCSLKEFDRRFERQSWWHMALLALLITLALILVPFGLRHTPRTVIESVSARKILVDVALITVTFGFIPIMAANARGLMRKFPFTCEHCKTLFLKIFLKIDLTDMGFTEICRSCGARVFDDNAAPSDAFVTAMKLRTRGEFLRLAQDFAKGDGARIAKITGLLAFILMLMSLVLLLPVGENVDLIGLALRSLVILCCLAGILAYAHLARQRARHRFGLACPSCQHTFNTREFKYLGYSGQCDRCNAQVVI